ncbi:MAG: hypothetical protein KF889_13920 [Alphaproteobacteria bacterium]|nr:hypothetical protein [Alphaproteobacteria bacterium]MCW5738905.1 hypothetical protein [Alphaproteobacteria bacterium]
MSQNQLFALISALLVLAAVLAMWLRGSRPQGWQTVAGGVVVAAVLVVIALVFEKA